MHATSVLSFLIVLHSILSTTVYAFIQTAKSERVRDLTSLNSILKKRSVRQNKTANTPVKTIAPTPTFSSQSKPKLNKRERWIKQIDDQINFVRTPNPCPDELTADPEIKQVEAIALAADDRKAISIHAMRVWEITEITSWIIVIESKSKPQTQAIALNIEEQMEEKFGMKILQEGSANSGWIVLDYGSIMVHVMTSQMKNFYKLEKKWKEGEVLDLSYILSASKADSAQETEDFIDFLEEEETVDEEDPFWK